MGFAPSRAEQNKIKGCVLFENWGGYHQRLKNVTITNKCYKDVIKQYDAANAFIYLDPPYETGGANDVSNASGGNWYGTVKPAELKKLLQSVKGKWMMSFSDHPDIKKEFGSYQIEKYQTIKTNTRAKN